MAAKLTRLVVSLLAAGSLGFAAPAQAAEEPPCVGHTDYVVLCVFPLECHVLGRQCAVIFLPECFGDTNVVAVCRNPVRCYAFGRSCL